jgi:hypothetical protein
MHSALFIASSALDALSIAQGGQPEGGAYAPRKFTPFPTGLPADPECAAMLGCSAGMPSGGLSDRCYVLCWRLAENAHCTIHWVRE